MKAHMKFLRSKVAIIFISIISILCIIAIAIAVDISIVMIKKQDQVLRPEQIEQVNNIQASAKPIKENRLEELDIYFNGQVLENTKAFSGSEESVFIPIDLLLGKLGINFKYYAPDDILEFSMNGKKITVKINQPEVIIGEEKVKLRFAAQVAKNHILVSGELLDHMGGVFTTGYRKEKSLFINYFPDLKKFEDEMRVLRTSNGVANISDILENKFYWKSRYESIGDDRIQASDNNDGYIIKALDKVFFIQDGHEGNPRMLDVDPSATWSADGEYIFWRDDDDNSSYCYNTDNGDVSELSGYFKKVRAYGEKVKNNISIFGGEVLLYDYINGNAYKRFVLTNTNYSAYYAIIERRAKTLVQGPVSFSPDGRSILYYETGEGYYTANADGSKKRFMGAGMYAQWINNSRVMLYGKNEMHVISKDGMSVSKTQAVWRKLGQTPKGDVFYTDGSMLYCETDGKEIKLLRLIYPCDYVYSADVDGPYIAVSKEQDKIYMIGSDTVELIGDYGQLLRGTDIKYPRPWGNSILASPNGVLVSILRSVDGAINVDVSDNKNGDIRSIALEQKESDPQVSNDMNMKWVDDKCLIVYTSDQGWLIKLEEEIQIYNWTEKTGSKIKGILK